MKSLLALSLLIGASPAMAAFNLECSGDLTTGSEGAPETRTTLPLSTFVYRIDLEAKRWCAGDCATTEKIADIQDTLIFFAYEPYGEPGVWTYVNRESGEYVSLTKWKSKPGVKDFYVYTSAHCQRAVFTGFPERKF